MKKKSIIIIVFSSILLLAGVAFFSFFRFVHLSNPIEIDGVSWDTRTEGKKEIVYHIRNKGLTSITIKEVTLNHGKQPKELALGISYSGHLVQPGTDDPMIKFMKIDAAPINPKLNPKEWTEAIHSKEKNQLILELKWSIGNGSKV